MRRWSRVVPLVGVFVLFGCGGGPLVAPAQPSPAPATVEAVPAPVEATPTTGAAAPANGGNTVEAEANRDGVVTVRGGERQALLSPQQALLGVGEGVDVDANGRAILRFGDLLTVEVLRDGELTVQQLAVDQQAAAITVLQNGGALINDFNPQKEIERRLTVQSGFATVTATGTRFMVVKEANSPLEWIVGLEASENDLTVSANGTTKAVTTGVARWMAPIGEPSAGISANMPNVEAWMDGLRSGVAQRELGEVVWSPADQVADTSGMAGLPPPGQPFSLVDTAQGGVELTLDPRGSYGLEDCNGDGTADIVIDSGAIQFDFRPVLARVRALDVTVLNRAEPGSGAVRVLDPARAEINSQPVAAGPGQTQVISLRSDRPYHYAELALRQGCFLGFSLTPPDPSGGPGEPRPAVAELPGRYGEQGEPAGRPADNGLIQALPVGPNGYAAGITIDGEAGDWSSLARLSGVDWTAFQNIVYDNGCAAAYPNAAGPDLSGQVRFAYDTGYLYAAFQVGDDGYVAYSGNDLRFFQGDAPQLLLDLDLAGDYDQGRVNEDDVQLDFFPGLRRPGFRPRLALWQLASLTVQEVPGAQVAASPRQGGYFLEAAIPWRYLANEPQPGLRLGLAASISDNDTPGSNAQECMISTAPGRNWQDPTTWGTLVLE